MRRSSALLGLLGLVFLGFGFVASILVGPLDRYVLVNWIVGGLLLLAYLTFGLDDFRALLGRRSTRYGAGTLVYTVLFAVLVAGANYLSWRHYQRWDVTEAGIYTLAPQSSKIVEALDEDLAMTAFVEAGQDPALESLFESYQYAAPSRVSHRLVDPDREPALVEQMKITTLRSVHLRHGESSFVVTEPTEESITNGIIRVTSSEQKVVYFTEGHGEPDLKNAQDPKGYSEVKRALEQENYEVKTLLLPAAEAIPEDATVVVLAGPERPLNDHETAALDAYLRRGGHLLALVGPRQGGEQLAELLGRWGIDLGDDIVIDRQVRLFEGPSLGIVPIARTYGTHPITENFRDITVYPQTRTVSPQADAKAGIEVTSLVKTSGSSWAETNVDDVFGRGVATGDDGDRPGPLDIAVAATATLADLAPNGAGGDAGASGQARVVVFGSSMFANNQQFVQSRLNGDLILNAAGWLVGQEELVSVRSRSVRASRADLTETQMGRVFYLAILIIPQLLVALGLAVWWQRKSR